MTEPYYSTDSVELWHLLDRDWPPIMAGYLARTALAPDREVA